MEETITAQEVLSYTRGPQDAKREVEIEARLKNLPEDERADIIQLIIKEDVGYAFMLARAVLSQQRNLERILLAGMLSADASTIQYPVSWIVPPLTPMELVQALRHLFRSNPVQVGLAIYHLPWILDIKEGGNTPEVQAAFYQLVDEVHNAGFLAFDPDTWSQPE